VCNLWNTYLKFSLVKIHTQEIQKLNLKSIINVLNFMGKVLCATADIATIVQMTQMRLSNLTVLHIHNMDLTKDVDDNLDKFVNKFINRTQ